MCDFIKKNQISLFIFNLVVIFFLKFEFSFLFFLLYANRNCIVQAMASMYRIRIEGHGCCLKLPSLRWYVPKTAPR